MSKLSNKHKWIKCFRCILMILFSLAFHNLSFSQLIHDFKVNQDTGLSIAKYDSKISSNKNGESIVVWAEYMFNGSIYAQLFDKNFKRVNSNFRINYFQDTNSNPDVAMKQDASFGVVWLNRNIFIRLFNKEGYPYTSNIRINDTLDQMGMDVRIGCDSSGRFIVVWAYPNIWTYPNNIYYQLIDSSGNKLGNNKKVNDGYLPCEKPAILVRNDGSFIITWQDYSPPGSMNRNIFMQMFDRNGNKIGANQMVNDDTVSLDNETTPFIASDSAGNFTIAFNEWIFLETRNRVYYQRYNKNGVKLGSNKQIPQAPYELYVMSFDSDERGNLVFQVNVNNAATVYMLNMRIDKNDIPIGLYFPVTLEYSTIPKDGRDIVLNNNRIVNLWIDSRQSPQPQIYANVRSFTNPDSTVSIKNITNGVPDKYYLYQNYPNPFNPVTKIRFDITETGNRNMPSSRGGGNGIVKLRVYDILGKEITTLVNERLQSGTYEVQFSIYQLSNNQISSGIYFYSLIIDNIIIQTNKMLLMK